MRKEAEHWPGCCSGGGTAPHSGTRRQSDQLGSDIHLFFYNSFLS